MFLCTWISLLVFELNVFQPFRFVERPAVRGFITYLNHTLRDNDIPKKSAIANSVNGKVIQLEEMTLEIIKVCPIRLLCVYNVCWHWPIDSESRRKFPLSGMDGLPVDDALSPHSASHLLTRHLATIISGSSRTISLNSTHLLDDTLGN